LTEQKNHHRVIKKHKTRSSQVVGLLLWRFGLLLAGGTGLYNVIKLVLRFVDLPLQIEIGIGLLLAGIVLVACSFIFERLIDYRKEGDLTR